MTTNLRRAVIAAVLCGLWAHPAKADEGMWTFDKPPTELLKQRYGFEPDQKWLDHLRLSSVRFMDGGSGSFASPNGLVVTNHHVAAGQLQKLSTAEKNYMAMGFYAAEPADEVKCPDLEVNVLVSTQEVTDKIHAAIEKGMSPSAALKARKAARAALEKACMAETGLRCDVVSLYQGGQYWLYRYKKYTDVRLVFAPERQAAFFGGDLDNFTYPRHDLDFAFFRVYEDGKPIHNEHWLAWDQAGAQNGELVFITGHPGSTDRLYTVRQLELNRDLIYPMYLDYIERTLAALANFAKRGAEQQRRALIFQFGFANGQKALSGEYRGLKSAELIAGKRKAEDELRAKVAAEKKLSKEHGRAWGQIEKVYAKYGKQIEQRVYRSLFRSPLASKALQIVHYVNEVAKKDADRLDGYHDSELESLRFRLLSPAPVYPDLEAVMLEVAMRLSLEKLPKDDPWAKALSKLGDPKAAAEKLMTTTKLGDPAVRKKLIEGGQKAVKASADPLIVWARELAKIDEANKNWMKKNVEAITTPAKEHIALARFAILGTKAYPDATFTLRMTFGPVVGYPYNGTQAQYQTTLYGLYDRALGFDQQAGWALPKRFWDRQKLLDLATQVNFVSECDIIGGNSGSPVVNKVGQFVGVVFDGNIESLSNRFIFDAQHSRAVSVSAAYILTALRKLYDAADLADEITQR